MHHIYADNVICYKQGHMVGKILLDSVEFSWDGIVALKIIIGNILVRRIT